MLLQQRSEQQEYLASKIKTDNMFLVKRAKKNKIKTWFQSWNCPMGS